MYKCVWARVKARAQLWNWNQWKWFQWNQKYLTVAGLGPYNFSMALLPVLLRGFAVLVPMGFLPTAAWCWNVTCAAEGGSGSSSMAEPVSMISTGGCDGYQMVWVPKAVPSQFLGWIRNLKGEEKEREMGNVLRKKNNHLKWQFKERLCVHYLTRKTRGQAERGLRKGFRQFCRSHTPFGYPAGHEWNRAKDYERVRETI